MITESAQLRAETESGPPSGPLSALRGGSWEPPPHRGSPGSCYAGIFLRRPRFTRPLSGGSSPCLTRRGEKKALGNEKGGRSAAFLSVLFLFARRFCFGGGRGRLLRRHRHLLGRDLARDEGDVHLVARFAVLGARAADEDRRARLELPPQHVVGERILDVALDRAAQRPGTHRRVV